MMGCILDTHPIQCVVVAEKDRLVSTPLPGQVHSDLTGKGKLLALCKQFVGERKLSVFL